MGAKGWQGAVLTAMGARFHQVTVTSVRDVTSSYRRVGFWSLGLLAGRAVHPTMWVRLWFPHGDRLAQRPYTLVEPDPESGRFDIEFALHDVDGPASAWARAAREGDTLEAAVLGSRLALPTTGIAGYLVVGDPASLPAINSLLTALPADAETRVWLEASHDEDLTLPIAVNDDLSRVTWVRRLRNGSNGSALPEELARNPFDASAWYAWVATDSVATRAIKTLLRGRYRVPRGHLHAQAYWIAGRAMGTSIDENPKDTR